MRMVARVAIFNPDGEVLLCTTAKGKGWVLPGGTVEPGETLKDAAAREALEEVGLSVQVGNLLFIQEFQPSGRPELVYEVAFRATADNPGPARFQHQDVDGPVRQVRWFSRDALLAEPMPVYPPALRQVWAGIDDAYLGFVKG